MSIIHVFMQSVHCFRTGSCGLVYSVYSETVAVWPKRRPEALGLMSARDWQNALPDS